MVGRLNDIVTAAVVVDATERIKSSSNDAHQKIQTTLKADTPTQIKPRDTKPAKGEQTDLTPQELQAQAADNLKRKQELEEQEKQSRIAPGSLTEEAVKNMTDALNELMDKTNVNLEFDYNKEVNLLSVKMLEKGTDKVIKEFPPEEMVENMIKARDWLGAFIDKTV